MWFTVEEHLKLGQRVYKTIMTDEQRETWDKMIGEKLSDKDLISIRIEMMDYTKK